MCACRSRAVRASSSHLTCRTIHRSGCSSAGAATCSSLPWPATTAFICTPCRSGRTTRSARRAKFTIARPSATSRASPPTARSCSSARRSKAVSSISRCWRWTPRTADGSPSSRMARDQHRGMGLLATPGRSARAGRSNRTGAKRPLIWNPRTGERSDLPLDELEGDIRPVDWSEDAGRILLCQVHQAVQQLYLYDLEAATLTRLEHPGGTFSFGNDLGRTLGRTARSSPSGRTRRIRSQLIALDGRTGAYKRDVLAAGEVPAGRPLASISFTSSDGQQIQGWLALPDGEGPFPTILRDASAARRRWRPSTSRRQPGLAGSWLRLPDDQLSRLDHIWPRV